MKKNKTIGIIGADLAMRARLSEVIDNVEFHDEPPMIIKNYYQEMEELKPILDIASSSYDFGEPIPRDIKNAKEVGVRTEPKIGRNDPCTCGSGNKYKKCCGK